MATTLIRRSGMDTAHTSTPGRTIGETLECQTAPTERRMDTKMPTSFRINIHDSVELVHRIVLAGAPTSSCHSCENDKKPMHVNKNKVLKKHSKH